ncbi:hypothetical protein BKA70DRAFT_6393 [Coprinopsis sp. MPI-PUGE-AT-0042]|nr:hypothetical protein BKA70DRAFT_6393 [Coprinopsis sp. MPI-PUGE-AT-0042]
MAEDPDKPPHIDANGGSTVTEVPTNGHATPEPAATKAQEPDVDLDAQEMVIASLRTQVQDLFTQVTQLNSKLVNSYDRVSDLEDDLHSASATLKNSNARISQLEMERTQHLAALNTGLLVEKSHVTTELNRLMEKATEEAAQRGQAESARAAIEKDLDDLSASLFAQANSMVAEARFARHLSEQKVIQSQQALKGAEEAVSIMQTQMQLLQSEKEEAEKKSQEMQAKMGKGKWLERIQSVDFSRPMKLMSSHLPYQEFLLFVAHLRSLHQTSQLPPAMTTILPLPFLARLASEDSEQTLRLDLAPSLNWLSRRSVQSAVHTGQLTIEPISVSTLLSDSTYSSPVTVAGLTNNSDSVPCALCGTPITTVTEYLQARLQRPHTLNQLNNSSWSGSFFKRQSTTSNHGSVSPTQSIMAAGPISTSSSQSSSQQIYIFRVAPQQTTSITSSLPIPSSITKSLSQSSTTATSPPHLSPMNGIAHSTSGSGNQPVTIYPLCTSGWCLRRLRSTCTMWAFVRTGIVERVWEEEMPSLPPQISTAVPHSTSTASPSTPGDKPPIPPRKRGLWGFASAIGEKAASWSDPDKKKQHTPSNSVATPPPVPPRRDSGMGRRGLPLTTAPETPPRQPATQAALPPIPTSESNSSVASSPVAPPVPRRSEGRKKSPPTPKALDLQGETGKDEAQDEALSTPTNKLLFDADSHQSPLKNDQPLPSVEDVVAAPAAGPTAASPSAVEEKKVEESGKPVPMKSNPNRFSLARSIPLPDSRPGTPSQAADVALHPPSRTASPATVPVPNGAAPPSSATTGGRTTSCTCPSVEACHASEAPGGETSSRNSLGK